MIRASTLPEAVEAFRANILRPTPLFTSEWVQFPRGQAYIRFRERPSPYLVLSNIIADRPGAGWFTALTHSGTFRDLPPGFTIELENVLNPSLESWAHRAGFIRIPDTTPPSYKKTIPAP